MTDRTDTNSQQLLADLKRQARAEIEAEMEEKRRPSTIAAYIRSNPDISLVWAGFLSLVLPVIYGFISIRADDTHGALNSMSGIFLVAAGITLTTETAPMYLSAFASAVLLISPALLFLKGSILMRASAIIFQILGLAACAFATQIYQTNHKDAGAFTVLWLAAFVMTTTGFWIRSSQSPARSGVVARPERRSHEVIGGM